MSYNNIMSTLGASNGATTPTQSYRPQLNSDEQSFISWLRAMGVDPQTLDPQVKLVYYQMWREISGKPALRQQG